ncbi:NfeD family protein [Sphingomonas sp. TZW2008]|uniref:NfeD family protein n=1 Tax=Sphingomonas sp. TZW2008 TaxID=1917973 RepID=UPI00211A4DDA|nr:NfeD family protein [Sphingomonas sp. TZW2008]
MTDAAYWLIAAVALGIAELLAPGVFFVFLAIAAGVVAATLLALPDLPPVAQLGAFGAWSVVTVLIGRRWYRDYPIESGDPLLNDRAGRMIGASVIVTEPIVGGRGRVRVGDGEWPATGPDTAAGTAMRITAIVDGIVSVEAL